MLKIYLAGKIQKNGWRNEVIAGISTEQFDPVSCLWRGMRFFYMGPFFISDDHGCYHGVGSHGRGAGTDGQACGTLADKPANNEWSSHVASSCLQAIDRSDVVLAWIEEGAYGTSVEIGYALARGKRVVCAGPGLDDPDLWFLFAKTETIYNTNDPVQFVQDFLSCELAPKLKFESPIEKSMYEALAPLRPRFETVPQHNIGSYRVDIAVIGKKTRIVIECDGHDFHEKTKEQVSRDNMRDRDLQSLGWKVLRYSGSEIYRRVDGCAAEVAEQAYHDEGVT